MGNVIQLRETCHSEAVTSVTASESVFKTSEKTDCRASLRTGSQ